MLSTSAAAAEVGKVRGGRIMEDDVVAGNGGHGGDGREWKGILRHPSAPPSLLPPESRGIHVHSPPPPCSPMATSEPDCHPEGLNGQGEPSNREPQSRGRWQDEVATCQTGSAGPASGVQVHQQAFVIVQISGVIPPLFEGTHYAGACGEAPASDQNIVFAMTTSDGSQEKGHARYRFSTHIIDINSRSDT